MLDSSEDESAGFPAGGVAKPCTVEHIFPEFLLSKTEDRRPLCKKVNSLKKALSGKKSKSEGRRKFCEKKDKKKWNFSKINKSGNPPKKRKKNCPCFMIVSLFEGYNITDNFNLSIDY
ncbi:hypothetical protein AVEN_104232-1 [Araneus ventricosus]|uniref:Uncharacterized protein n=1 Tax=Araneus ventricosus TaxID=182803 RepID=A0A4Y2FDR0_ARAVE|nr:hypothetical protein AVEN_104232-1 [Araneus ventricosus]